MSDVAAGVGRLPVHPSGVAILLDSELANVPGDVELDVKADVFQRTVYCSAGGQPTALTNIIARMKQIAVATAGAEQVGTNTDPVEIAKASDGLEPGGPQTWMQFGAPESS